LTEKVKRYRLGERQSSLLLNIIIFLNSSVFFFLIQPQGSITKSSDRQKKKKKLRNGESELQICVNLHLDVVATSSSIEP
jgi:hypothetical protein